MIHDYLSLSILLFCLGILGVISRRNVLPSLCRSN